MEVHHATNVGLLRFESLYLFRYECGEMAVDALVLETRSLTVTVWVRVPPLVQR